MNIFTYIQTIRKKKARSLRLSRTDNLILSNHIMIRKYAILQHRQCLYYQLY